MSLAHLIGALALFAFSALGEVNSTPPPIPQEWREFVVLDRAFNVVGRESEIISQPKESQQSVPIYHFDIPLEEAQHIRSRGMSASAASQILITGEDGKEYVRFFIVNSNTTAFRFLKRAGFKLGEDLKQEYWGVKLQSHGTYFIWKENADPLMIKMTTTMGASTYNFWSILTGGVLGSEAVSSIHRDHPETDLSFLPETFVAETRLGQREFSNLVREIIPITGLDRKAGEKLLPLHGFLGSPQHLKTYARKMGVTVEEWKYHFLDQLAKSLADGLVRTGVLFEGHSQNLLLKVNSKTGRVVEVVGRDLSDVLHIPQARIAGGKPLRLDIYGPNGPDSTAYQQFVDAKEAKDPGFNVGIYAGQVVWGMSHDAKDKERYAGHLLRQIRVHAESALGKPLQLPPQFDELVTSLEEAREWERPPVGADKGSRPIQRFGPTKARLGWGVSLLSEAFSKTLFSKIENPNEVFPQKLLRQTFKESMGRGKVAFLYPKALSQVRRNGFLGPKISYHFENRRIIAYLTETEMPIATTHPLTTGEVHTLNNPAPDCSLFSRLRAQIGL